MGYTFHGQVFLVLQVLFLGLDFGSNCNRSCTIFFLFDLLLSIRVRKPTTWASNQVLHKLASAATEAGWKLKILDLRRGRIVLSGVSGQ